MKKIVLFLILFIPFKINALSASSYIVMDANSKRVLEGSNINSKKLIASTTKIMTAIITLENIDVNKEVKISNEVLKAYGSAIYIEVGERIKIIDLLYGLMLRSGNDAAIELAQSVSGSMEKFVELMNEKAKELNMNDTVFINNHGLENNDGNGNVSSAYDMALLMQYALSNNRFKEIIKTKKYICKSSYKTYVWFNKNKLLDQYNYCIGGKTGFTKKARRTLVTAAQKDDKTIIVVTLNDPNDFSNQKKLYESNFDKYKLVTILDKNKFNIDDSNYKDKVYINNDFKMLLTNDEEKKVKINYNLYLNTSNDNKIGVVQIYFDNKKIGDIDILLKNKNNESKKNWFQKIIDFLIFWK